MRRIPEMDGLRGLAAITVVLFHLYITVVPFGWAAVDLFFVLSGFLITSIVLDQMESPGFLRTFYARRSLRIWPIYYLAMVVLMIATTASWRCWLPFGLYLQNTSYYLMPPGELAGKVFTPDWPTFNHTWSLAVEEQFYLVWPGLILLAGRHRARTMALGFLAVSVIARWVGYPHTMLLTRCDGLALGAVLATVLHRPDADAAMITDADRRADVRPWIRIAAVMLALLAVRLAWGWHIGRVRMPLSFRMEDPAAEVLAVSLLAFMAVAWVVVESGHRRFAWLRVKPLRDLGTISYGVYLYHALVLHSVDAILPRTTPGFRILEGLITLTCTVAVATLSWRFIERPILSLKDRFDYRSATREPSHPMPVPSASLALAHE